MVRFELYTPNMSKLGYKLDTAKCHAAVHTYFGGKIPGVSLGRTEQCSRKAGPDGLCGIHRNLKARNEAA